MTEKLIKNYLSKPFNEDIVDTLRLYLMNDSFYYHSSVLPCRDYARKRIKKGDFNKILFIQNVKLGIDFALRSLSFRREYYDLPERIGLPERYQVAKSISQYILSDLV